MHKLIIILFCVLTHTSFATEGIKIINVEKSSQEEKDGIQFYHAEWDEILKIAQKENKLIFMDCYTSWCGPCKMLAKNVFPQKELGDFFNDIFISVKYDMEKDISKELAEQLKVKMYPTMLILNDQGEEIDRIAGYREARELIKWVKEVRNGKTLFSLKEKYENGERDKALVLDYIFRLISINEKGQAEVVIKEYFKSLNPDELLIQENWQLINYFFSDPYSREILYVNDNYEKFSELYGKNKVWAKLDKVFHSQAESFASKENGQFVFDDQKMKAFKNFMAEHKVVVQQSVNVKIECMVAARRQNWSLFTDLVSSSLASNAEFVDAKLMCDWTYWVGACCDDISVQTKMLAWIDKAIEEEQSEMWKERLGVTRLNLVEKMK